MKTRGIGMIGCGGMGRALVNLLLKDRPDIKIKAVFDPDERSIKETIAKLAPDAVVYDDYKKLVKSPDIECVMIASWNCFHKEQTIAAFRAGKNVFCQKPLATNFKDCLAMLREWKKSGKEFTIGFTLRYSPHYRKVKELIASGAIGRIISMEFNETLDFNHGGYIMGDWRRLTKYSGTHLLEKCCHDIDLANWMVDSVASRVASFGGLDFFVPGNEKHIERIGKSKDGKVAFSTWGGLFNLNPFTADKDIIDNQVAIIEYKNGIRATFHTNCSTAIPERRMYICGTEGAIRADVIKGEIQVKRLGFDTQIEDKSTEGKGGHGGGDSVLASEIYESMIHGAKPAAGFMDGIKSAVTCFAIDKAMETGKVVSLDPYWKRAGVEY